MVVHPARSSSPTLEFRELCERNLDLVLTRIVGDASSLGDELNVEPPFEERLVVVAGAKSGWARRRKVDLAYLADAPWILTPPDCWTIITGPNGRAITLRYTTQTRNGLLHASPGCTP